MASLWSMKGQRMLFIMVWKVAGELHSPKNMTSGSKSPWFMEKAAPHPSPSLRQCRRENGSLHDPPMETSFGHWNTLLLSQDENPIIGRICAGNLNIWFSRCLPNRDVISSLNPPNSHDPNGGTYIRIGGLLKEK